MPARSTIRAGPAAPRRGTRSASSLAPAGVASALVKSCSSMRRPMLNGVVRVSRIRSDGVATPSRQKAEPVELRILGAPVVALADGGKELIGGKLQAADGVDFVHEDDHAARIARQNHVPQGLQRNAGSGPSRALRPPEFAPVPLPARSAGPSGTSSPSVPLIGCQVLADGGQVETAITTPSSRSRSRPHHQRRLAHLAGRQHVAELPLTQTVERSWSALRST